MYDKFICEELKYSKKFLYSNQIFEDRFDECEYYLIKSIFNNNYKINKIFKVIDDILRIEKFDCESRFLIFGDFIFSMGSPNLDDPSKLILKTSRNSYIKNITIRSEINKDFGYDPCKYISVHKKLLIGLRSEKILERNFIRVKDDEWSTIVYIKLNVEVDFEKSIFIGYSAFPFIISLDKKYSIGSFRNIWVLKRKKREMVDFPLCIKSVIKSNTLKLRLDRGLYEINKFVIEKEKILLLEKVGCDNIDNFLIKLKKIVSDEKYFKKKDKILENNLNDIVKIELKSDLRIVLEYYQKILPFIILERNIIGSEYYLPCFMDNRGRQYLGTAISPTFYKIFRYLCSFVNKKNIINLTDSTFYKKIISHYDLVKEFGLNMEKSYIIIVFFIEIGKHFIKTEDSCFVKTDDIIKAGISNYSKENLDLKFSDYLYVNKIINNVKELLKNDECDINTLIFKDATASGLQNYGILSGYKKDMLKYLNIDGDDWCDTYQYLIDKFIPKNDKFSKRKYWKNTIMTIPYNSVWYSCFSKFIEKLREDDIEYNNLCDNEKNNLIDLHKKFYNNIKKNVKKEFFSNNNVDLVDFKYNEWKILQKKDYKITYKKLRDKYTDVIYDIIEDVDSSLRAKEANNMHYLDAKLIKMIMESFDILPIHDCFGIRLCELHLVMDEINAYYSKIIGENTYNIHIIK